MLTIVAAVSTQCLPPKCKPYASVIHAECDYVELNITYPRSQHGYNRSINVWGNIWCNDEIGGFQIWVVGQGILKRFLKSKFLFFFFKLTLITLK